MSQQIEDFDELDGQEGGPNWTLVIVGYFATLAVVMVLLRPLHLSMGGIFFAMVAAAVVMVLGVLAVKGAIRKAKSANVGLKDLYHLGIGYNRYARDEDEEDEGEQVQASPSFIEDDPLYLGERFQPSFHAFLCVMCLIIGIRRSGKSTLLLALVEALGRYGLPFVLFDTMGEYSGLVNRQFLVRPRLGGNVERMDVPAAAQGLVASLTADNAYRCGQTVMSQGLQLVVNLKGYNDDEAAIIMSEIVDGVNDWQEGRSNSERPPMMFFLDEAQKWFPQNPTDKAPDISNETQGLLNEAFIGQVVERGGKNGLGLVAATQRYSRLNKNLLQSQWKFYLRQTEEIDLARYKRQGIDPDEAKALQQGECIAYGPNVDHFRFQVRQSSIPHEGHTPNAAALAKYTRELAASQVLDTSFVRERPAPVPAVPATPTPAPAAPMPKPKTELELVLEAYNANPGASYRELGKMVGMGKDKVGGLIEELRERGLIVTGSESDNA